MKQPNIGDKYSTSTIQREARMYELVYGESGFADIRSIIPKLVGFDTDTNILTIEFINDSQSLNEYYYNTYFDKFPTRPSFTLGNIMARYHKAFKIWINNEKFSFFPKSYPYPFFIARPSPDIFSHISPANLQLLKIIQKYSDISNHLSSLHHDWNIETLIHGDMKWDNVIIRHTDINSSSDSTSADEQIDMKIVDWELCDIGDPCWDIGAAFQDFISFWLFSLPITGKEKPEQLITSAEHPIQNMKESIRAFWLGYINGAGIKNTVANKLLYKSAKYCAARLIHKAYESQQSSSQLSNTAIYMVQTSLNILSNIENAIIQLFGIPYGGDRGI